LAAVRCLSPIPERHPSTARHGQGCEGYDTTHDTNCPRLPGRKHSFPATPVPPVQPPPEDRVPSGSGNFFAKRPFGGCYIGSMPRKAKPLPLLLVDPAGHPPPGFRAMLIRRVKMKYPELSESQIARYVGCSPSNVHQVLKSFLACRPIRDRTFRV
jgi:hypothetical protein